MTQLDLFTLCITFTDLCAFVPTDAGRAGYFLLPEVRRPVNDPNEEPLHAHFPVVILPPESNPKIVNPQGKTRLLRIEGAHAVDGRKVNAWYWFLDDAQLEIDTGKSQSNLAFADAVDHLKVCHFDWVWEEINGPKPRLNPILTQPLPAIGANARGSLKKLLNARVLLNDGTLTEGLVAPQQWRIDGQGKPRQLSEKMALTIPDAQKAILTARSFDLNWEEKLVVKAPTDGQLDITIMNSTPEIELGLNFTDQEHRAKEQNRARHFKLFHSLTQTEGKPAPSLGNLYPHMVKPLNPNPVPHDIIFCPPGYFPNKD